MVGRATELPTLYGLRIDKNGKTRKRIKIIKSIVLYDECVSVYEVSINQKNHIFFTNEQLTSRFDANEKGSCALYTTADISRIIEMAWEDRTPFEAILLEYGLNESAVIRLMRQQLKKK